MSEEKVDGVIVEDGVKESFDTKGRAVSEGSLLDGWRQKGERVTVPVGFVHVL